MAKKKTPWKVITDSTVLPECGAVLIGRVGIGGGWEATTVIVLHGCTPKTLRLKHGATHWAEMPEWLVKGPL